MITLTLSYPPSANRLWRNVNGKTLKSGHYRLWLAEALADLRAQRAPSLKGSYRLIICATRPDNRRRDLGNLEKPISDALVQAGVVEDDSLAQRIVLEWSGANPTKGGAITVAILPADDRIHELSKSELVALKERIEDVLANRFAEAA